MSGSLAELIARMRALGTDHEPDGWPAVRMWEICALCDALEGTRTDAARYRFLRDSDEPLWRPFALRRGCSGSSADTLVDAAMADAPRMREVP